MSKCTFIPEAPRVAKASEGGHSEAVNDSQAKTNKLVASPKKSPKKTMKKKPGTAKKAPSKEAKTAIKNEKALYNMNPKSVTNETVAKAIKSGNLEQLEIATLMGKGKMVSGKATWNDAARNYIKSVPKIMEDLDQLFKASTNGDIETIKSLLEKDKKYVFARDPQGTTPLHLAAQNGHSQIVKHFLSENAEFTQIVDPVRLY